MERELHEGSQQNQTLVLQMMINLRLVDSEIRENFNRRVRDRIIELLGSGLWFSAPDHQDHGLDLRQPGGQALLRAARGPGTHLRPHPQQEFGLTGGAYGSLALLLVHPEISS